MAGSGPSAQDLLITSTAGAVLGELSDQATKKLAIDGFQPWERVVLVVINPVWIAQHGFSADVPGRQGRAYVMRRMVRHRR